MHLLRSKMTPEGRWLLDGDWVRERVTRDRKVLLSLEGLSKPSK